MRVEETVLNTLLPAVEQGSEVYYFLTLYEGRYMPHFIVVPEIMDSSVKPMKTKDRYLNTDHIVSFQGEGEERCLIKTVNGSLDVLLSPKALVTLCSPETVTTGGEGRKLTPEDLDRFITLAEGPMVVMEPGMGDRYPQKANVGLPRLAGMDHSRVHKPDIGLGKLGEMQLGEPVEWNYPEVQLTDVSAKSTYVAIESNNVVRLYKLSGYAMPHHPHKTAVSSGLLNRYKNASQHTELPVCQRLRVLQAENPVMIAESMGWVFSDYTVDGKYKEYALTSEMMDKKKEEVTHDYLIREVVPHQAITVGPLYLMVKKTTGEFVLYNVYSNARTSHILRQVYDDVNREFIRRNLADEIGDVEVKMLGRAATYNQEQVVFHVNPYSDQFDSSDTQSWTVDRKLIVTPGSQYDENGLREVEWEACEDNKRYIVAVYQRDGVPDCKVFDYRNIHLEVANKGILKTTLSRARYLPTANSVLEDTYQVVDKPALHHPSRATFKLYKSPDEVVVATRDPILKEINKGN